MLPKPSPRDDIGPHSAGEWDRLNANLDELRNDRRRLESKVIGLESEVEDLKASAPIAAAAEDPLRQTLVQVSSLASDDVHWQFGLEEKAQKRRDELRAELLQVVAELLNLIPSADEGATTLTWVRGRAETPLGSIEIKPTKADGKILYRAFCGDEIITASDQDTDVVKKQAGEWVRQRQKMTVH
jgi:hypothetical protein